MTDQPDTSEPVQIELLTVEQLLSQAQEPKMAAIIDEHLNRIMGDEIQERQLLRTFAMVMRLIAQTMPWDEENGLDARRFNPDVRMLTPSWRECIGAALGLEFTKKDEEDEVEADNGLEG